MNLIESRVMRELAEGPRSTRQLFVACGLRTRPGRRALGAVLRRLRTDGEMMLIVTPSGRRLWERLSVALPLSSAANG